jgi:hypothetical protein
MKYLGQLCAASVLALTFAISVFAGEAECPGVVNPPPPPTAATIGDAPCPGLQLAESIIQSLLSLS